MHLLVLVAITTGAGALAAVLAVRRPKKEPIPVRIRARVQRRHD